MGQRYGKAIPVYGDDSAGATATTIVLTTPSAASSAWPSPYPHGVAPSPSPGRSKTPSRLFWRPFPPPSPAKHIKVALARRHDTKKPKEGTVLEDGENTICIGGLKSKWYNMRGALLLQLEKKYEPEYIIPPKIALVDIAVTMSSYNWIRVPKGKGEVSDSG